MLFNFKKIYLPIVIIDPSLSFAAKTNDDSCIERLNGTQEQPKITKNRRKRRGKLQTFDEIKKLSEFYGS